MITHNKMDGVFPQVLVDEFFGFPRHRAHEPISRFYVAIDPNAGQHDVRLNGGSDYTVVSIYHDGDYTVIAGAEAIDVHDPEYYLEATYRHLCELRRPVEARNAQIVVVTECDTGHEARHIQQYIQGKAGPERLENVVFIQATPLKSGVYTSSSGKKEMALKMKQRLEARNLRIADEFINVASRPDDVLDALRTQMVAYTEFQEDPTKSVRDDVVVAAQLAIFWSSPK